MEARMGRKFVWILGALLLTAILATPAAAQVSVSVGIGVPPIAAGVVVGAPVYPAYPPPPYYYYPYAYPYYPYPVYGRVYYGPRYYYGPRGPYYYRGAPRYYGGARYYNSPAYRNGPVYRSGPVYRGNARVAPGAYSRSPQYARGGAQRSRGNGRR
jgi:hypothetical protein